MLILENRIFLPGVKGKLDEMGTRINGEFILNGKEEFEINANSPILLGARCP